MRRSQVALHIVLTIFLAVGAVAFVLQSAIALRTDDGLDYGEGIVLWQAANVTDWKKAFHPVEEYPHSLSTALSLNLAFRRTPHEYFATGGAAHVDSFTCRHLRDRRFVNSVGSSSGRK